MRYGNKKDNALLDNIIRNSVQSLLHDNIIRNSVLSSLHDILYGIPCYLRFSIYYTEFRIFFLFFSLCYITFLRLFVCRCFFGLLIIGDIYL